MVLFSPVEGKRLLLATHNPGKAAELRSLLADLAGIELVTPSEAGLEMVVEESGRTYAENAALKARAFADASGLPALADDSGLEVDALNGEPGLHSARVAGTAAERRALLVKRLEDIPLPWRATFRSTVCLAMPDGDTYFAAGECAGEIIPLDRGSGGFGYDPIFVVAGMARTMAELSLHEKNQLSHRALAIKGMKSILRQRLAL